jgi:putative flippase GtrA
MRLLAQLVRFGCVGVVASAVHFAVGTLLVPQGIAAEAANVAGFLAAFHFSYLGHGHWTFRGARQPQSYRRMFLLALAGFSANEAVYCLGLHHSSSDYRLLLVIVLALQAVATFVLSRIWVFRSAQG